MRNPIKHFWRHRNLIKQFTKREVSVKYKGSYLGILWSFMIPACMLIVYTFVFSVVFKAKWSISSDNKVEFALILFCGITVFGLFSEVVAKAPSLVTNQVNYVKKVVFPLEIFPVVLLLSALVNTGISLMILLCGLFFFLGVLHWTIVLVPLILLPIMLISLGVTWFLAALGVYLRDISHIIGVAISALMFLSPIFYSVDSVPQGLRFIYDLNPLSYAIENMRKVMIWGTNPDWLGLLLQLVVSFFVAILGYWWFQRTRSGFADVL